MGKTVEILLNSGRYTVDSENPGANLRPGDVVVRNGKSHYVTMDGNLIVWNESGRRFNELPASASATDVILRLASAAS